MKKILRSLLLLVILSATSQFLIAQNLFGGNGGDDPELPTIIQFEQSEYQLGEFTAGDTVHAVFKFKNIGDEDLLIQAVKPSCACAKLIYTESVVKPGGMGQVSASIDTADKEGAQTKYFTVLYNGNPPAERVTLRFNVTVPEGAVEQGHSDGDNVK